MQNQVSPQYLPNQPYAPQIQQQAPVSMPQVQQPQPPVSVPQAQQLQTPMAYPQTYPTYPASGVGAVNIQIFNPTANPAQGFYQPVPCSYPCNYNNLSFQPQAPIQQQPQVQGYSPNEAKPLNSIDTMNLNQNKNGIAAQSNAPDNQTNIQDNKPKIPLTDDYVKTLENYLNSQDKKIRLMGAKELFDRFKEDETRKQDPALTALLNKILQDPAETVKFVGLTALDSGYAMGNNETAQILNQMQGSNSSYGEDAALASQVLLKMSGNQAKASAGQSDPAGAVNLQNNELNQNTQNLQMQNMQPEMSMQKGPQNDINTLNKLPQEGEILLNQNGAQNAPVAPNTQAEQNV